MIAHGWCQGPVVSPTARDTHILFHKSHFQCHGSLLSGAFAYPPVNGAGASAPYGVVVILGKKEPGRTLCSTTLGTSTDKSQSGWEHFHITFSRCPILPALPYTQHANTFFSACTESRQLIELNCFRDKRIIRILVLLWWTESSQ